VEREDSPQRDADVTLSIKALEEEFLQISELSELEKSYSGEVISLLKAIIEPLNATFHVKPSSVSKTDSSINEVVLTPQGILCIMRNNGSMNSRPIESLPSEILVKVLMEVIPEVKRLLIERRQKVSTRVATLEKVLREFRKVSGGPASAAARRPASGIPPSVGNPRKGSKDKNSNEDALKSAFSDAER
jgi:hypothetical protein